MTDPITPPEETPNVSPGDTTDGGGSGSDSDNVDGDNGASPVDPVQPTTDGNQDEVTAQPHDEAGRFTTSDDADTDAVTPETPSEPEFNVGDAVTVKSHNGNDTGKTGVIESVDGDTRVVHLSDGRHIAFNVGQLM